jgi:hypothetical protein
MVSELHAAGAVNSQVIRRPVEDIFGCNECAAGRGATTLKIRLSRTIQVSAITPKIRKEILSEFLFGGHLVF